MRRKAALLAVTTLLAGGCGSLPPEHSRQADGAPGFQVDVSSIPDAVPRPEPRSKYGNPESYVVAGRRYRVLASSKGYVERGIASWYGTKFHGRRAAIGEPYDMFAMTAAHRTLPLPTYAEVTNLENGRKVIVKITDRGPFKANRIIDLSYAAAAKLGITRTGTGLVEIRAIDPVAWQRARQRRRQAPPPPKAAGAPSDHDVHPSVAAPPSRPLPLREAALYLQIGAFSDRRNAEALRRRLQKLAPDTIRIVSGNGALPLYKVHIGPLPSVEDADRMTRTLEDMGLGTPRIVIY